MIEPLPIPPLPPAEALFRQRMYSLFDPERPEEDPNALLNRMGGRLTDPNAMNHNCPMCNRTLSWLLFRAHLRPCYAKWRKVKLDITHRRFQGGSVADARTPEGTQDA